MLKKTNPRRERKRSGARWVTLVMLASAVSVILVGGLSMLAFFIQLDRSLPSTQSLKSYRPPLVTRVYASDGSLQGEFFIERRYVVPLSELPPHLIKSFLAAEDVRFYEHGGVDFLGVVRALFKNIQAGEIVQGGSTITQQVVKSLLLTPERTWIRKIKEAILAYRIDRSLSKDEILYLYLNQIYFGSGAYGVEAAARTYFEKHARDLTLAESSLLAGLPKAPSRFSPTHNMPAAQERQRYVLQRMLESGFATSGDVQKAQAEPIKLARPRQWTLKELDHFTEEVRRQLESRYGKDGLYKEGLSVYTTLSPKIQVIAQKALDQGLRELDKRHRRYRGLHANVPREEWNSTVKILSERNGSLAPGNTAGALVMSFDSRTSSCLLHLGSAYGKLSPSGWEWAKVSAARAGRMFRVGDIIRVRLDKKEDESSWSTVLEQDPGMEGALMAVVPETGQVVCMVGGRDFQKSQFNRATQAVRQPGSSFKPIIYAAALDRGYNEASILIDSPFVRDDHSLRGPWKPANYDRQFWGPITLRKALVHSRNVVTVKLLDDIGTSYAISYARRLGISSPLTPTLALALGASGVTLSELITAYTPFANLGERADPYLIEKVYDRKGNLLEDHRPKREKVISPQTAYIMTHLLQGVIEEGTGTKAKQLGRPAAGKTGTTNELKDAWFVGFTPNLLAGVWIGYDDHNLSLGKGETGGRAACPIWLYFMEQALKDEPIQAFKIPAGVVLAKMDPGSGYIYRSNESGGVYAAFDGEPPANRRTARSSSQDDEAVEVDDGHSEVESTTHEDSPPRPSSPSRHPAPADSYFKSDLF
ncbi:MAG: PBP1A family penicillin-binding protein [Syntrophobacteraceae bacterium]|jgi:penicillin-binding protein 1A|nr:PBP1A family penicillin-binding protein [Syntrophobacteraceae bacterium]